MRQKTIGDGHDIVATPVMSPPDRSYLGTGSINGRMNVARSVVDACRGVHPEFVFTYKGKPIELMNNNGWQKACERAADRFEEEFGRPAPPRFRCVRVHDLKHACGRRLRPAGVPHETRQVLPRHTHGDITSHYSAPELRELIDAAQRISRDESGKNSDPHTRFRRRLRRIFEAC